MELYTRKYWVPTCAMINSYRRMKVQVNSKAVTHCEIPKFAACEFVKGDHRSNKVNTIKNNPMKEQYLKKDHIMPVNLVSTDHYISRYPDRLYHTKGKSDPYEMFSGGCVIIGHVVGYVIIKHQVYINAT